MNKLYIGNLPSDCVESDLQNILSECNCNPISITLKKGFAFLELNDTIDTNKAINQLNGFNLMGCTLCVEPSVPQNKKSRGNKLLVSNIPNSVHLEDTRNLLSNYGKLEKLEQGSDKTDTEYTTFATFQTEEEAHHAFTQINGQNIEGNDLKAEFVMSDKKEGRSGQIRNHRTSFRSSNTSGNVSSPLRPTDFPLRILVLSDMVGAIIGRSGGTIRQITQQTRARVDVHRKENAGALEKVITIYGNPDNCSEACKKILEVMQTEANNTNRGEIPLKILAHNNLIGRIIGKSGNTIKRIMEQTDTKITVSSSIHDVNSFNLERIITIKGNLENICRAESMISQRLRQSYESDLAAIAPQAVMFPGLHPMAMMSTLGTPNYSMPGPSSGLSGRGGPPSSHPYGLYNPPAPYTGSVPQLMYASNASGLQPSTSALTAGFQAVQGGDQTKEMVFLYIPNTAVGAIIGTGGTTIRDMISSSGASIKVAQPTKEEATQAERLSERKVTIIGSPESQWKAQFMIYRKVGCEGYPSPAGPQEAMLRVEIMIPSSQVGRIIGKGGSVVREMQRNTRATIKLPEESSTGDEEETPVHIIGDFMATQSAQRQIRAIIAGPSGRTTVPSVGKPTKYRQTQPPTQTAPNHQQHQQPDQAESPPPDEAQPSEHESQPEEEAQQQPQQQSQSSPLPPESQSPQP